MTDDEIDAAIDRHNAMIDEYRRMRWKTHYLFLKGTWVGIGALLTIPFLPDVTPIAVAKIGAITDALRQRVHMRNRLGDEIDTLSDQIDAARGHS